MMEALMQFPVGFIIALSGALIPGPLLAYVIAKTGQSGKYTGVFAAAGHMIVEFMFLALIAAGLGVVLSSLFFQVGLGLFGGGMLLILGALALWRLGKGENGDRIVVSRRHPLIGGIMFSTVLNPSVPVWWVTVGFVTLMEAYVLSSAAGVMMWLLGHFSADFLWFSGISFAVAGGKRLMGTRGYRVLLVFCAAVLVLIGVYFLSKYGLTLARMST